MKKATAKRTFRRTDTREVVKAGGRIIATDGYVDELDRQGLVRNVVALPCAPENKAMDVPTRAAGKKQSASPAVRALQEQTLKKSGSGARSRKKTGSL